MKSPYALFAESASSPVAIGAKTVDSKQIPTQRFIKDVASVGTYTHPTDKWTLEITPEKLRAWAETFAQMKANGVDVEVVKDHSQKAEDVVGYISDMYVDGDRLYAVHDMQGDAAIELAKRVRNVSPWIDLDFRDGKSNRYGEAITHSAIVQSPVIPGQHPFQAIAASMKASALVLSTNRSEHVNELLTALRALLGVGDELTEDNAAELVQKHIADNEKAATEAETQSKELQAEIDKLGAQIEELKAGTAKKPEPDTDTVEMLAEGAIAKIDSLVDTNAVTPAIAASLKSAFIGDEGKRNAYALSAAYSGRDVSLVKQICDILKDNQPIAVGEKTRGQTLSLSRTEPDADDEEAKEKSRKEVVGWMVPPKAKQAVSA